MSFDAFAESPSFSSDLTWMMHGKVTPCSQTGITGRGQSLDKSLHNKNENRKGSSDAEWKKRKHCCTNGVLMSSSGRIEHSSQRQNER